MVRGRRGRKASDLERRARVQACGAHPSLPDMPDRGQPADKKRERQQPFPSGLKGRCGDQP